jgi:chromosome segregation ATPase
VADLTTERDNAEAKLQELSSGQTKSSEEQSVLQKEKEALESKVQELDSEKEEVESKISELRANNETLVNDLDAAKQQVNDLMAQVEKSDANYKALLSEKDECVNQVQLAADEKARASADEIHRLNGQLLSLNQQVAAANTGGGDSPVVDSLKEEIIELKSLLSSANASVDEARSAALLADQELEEKELQLENALRNLAEHEDARRVAEDKLRLAELSPRNSPARTDSEEELLRDMEGKCLYQFNAYLVCAKRFLSHTLVVIIYLLLRSSHG